MRPFQDRLGVRWRLRWLIVGWQLWWDARLPGWWRYEWRLKAGCV